MFARKKNVGRQVYHRWIALESSDEVLPIRRSASKQDQFVPVGTPDFGAIL
jgi:hypothetical protein